MVVQSVPRDVFTQSGSLRITDIRRIEMGKWYAFLLIDSTKNQKPKKKGTKKACLGVFRSLFLNIDDMKLWTVCSPLNGTDLPYIYI